MSLITDIAILTVAAAHLAFLWLEMFQWDKPLGMRIFGSTPEFAMASKTLAANQGFYNGFLAAGLVWSVWPFGMEGDDRAIAIFFLICIIIAGIYGAITVSRRILRVQALPAVIALALVLFTVPGG